MKRLFFLFFLLPVYSFSQSFSEFAINPNGDISLGDIVEADGKLYFSAATIGGDQTGLWVTDGTLAQTMLFSQVFHGGNVFQYDLATLNGQLYFHGEPEPEDQVNGTELWTSDGTLEGTQLLLDINPGPAPSQISAMIEFGNELFFAANDGTNGLELWKTDGTANGTMMVKDIQPGANGSMPTNFTVVENTLFFKAFDEMNGFEIWKTDGTSTGTELVIDLNPGPSSSSASGFVAYGSQLVFSGADGVSGQELWMTDGTTSGTVQIVDVNPGSGSSYPSYMAVKQGQIYFSADDGTSGNELWVSDGTTEGSQLIKDINPGAADSYPADFLVFDDKLYFAATDGTSGYEIWETDGTELGTSLLLDILPGDGGSNPTDLIHFGANLYFIANANATDRKLYKSDGTANGTISIQPASATNSNPLAFASFSLSAIYQGDFYFTAHFNEGGRELWRLSDDATTIEEPDVFQPLKVFPNPSADSFYIDLEESFSQIEIAVLNVLGEVIALQTHAGSGIIPVQWEGTPGVYFLRVQADAKLFTRKVLKE